MTGEGETSASPLARALAAEAAEKPRVAIECLRQVAAGEPERARVATRLIQPLQKLKDWRGARDAMEMALAGLSLTDNRAPAFAALARLRDRTGDWKGALAILDRLLDVGLLSADLAAWRAQLEGRAAKPSVDGRGGDPGGPRATARERWRDEGRRQREAPHGESGVSQGRGGRDGRTDERSVGRGGRRGGAGPERWQSSRRLEIQRPPPSIGNVARRYQIGGLLGEGGFGEVRVAFDRALNCRVAMKTLRVPPGLARIAFDSFRAEIKTLAKLHHPAIITPIDVIMNEDMVAYTMELVTGKDLFARVEETGAVGSEELLPIARDVCDALYHAHRTGFVHRDIKPHNLIQSADGRIKLLDFGLAKAIDGTPELSGMAIGTPHFMSPEQARCGAVTPATDIYSLGCTLYFLLAGRPPFPDQDVLAHHVNTPAPNIEEHVSGLPHGLGRVIQLAMEKAPSERFQSTRGLYKALRQVFGAARQG